LEKRRLSSEPEASIILVDPDSKQIREIRFPPPEDTWYYHSLTWSPDGSQLAFIVNNDIWVINLDGSGLQRLTEDGQPKSRLEWTLADSALFFVSGATGSTTQGGERTIPAIQRLPLRASEGQLQPFHEQMTTATAEPLTLGFGCEVAGLYASPNGRWVAVDINCEDASSTQVLEVATGQIRQAEPAPYLTSMFLDWAPDGDTLVLRVEPVGEDTILLVNLVSGTVDRLATPPYTYDVTLSPDGRRVLYSLSRGLGLGSETWIMNRDGSGKRLILQEPRYIVAYARWSPTGNAIAYIRMADSNIPFTVGELWLADGEGQNRQRMAEADAGHGYPPVWSPDGSRVAFVGRENRQDIRADNVASELESNIYLADMEDQTVRPLTRFPDALTDGPAWSPDGQYLAFSTDAGGVADIWLVEIGTAAIQQLTHNVGARWPVWVRGEP